MFVFEDIVQLDDRSLQRLLREVDLKELALALKAASDELTGKIKGAMSKRAVEALSEEMEFLGPSARARRGGGAGRRSSRGCARWRRRARS